MIRPFRAVNIGVSVGCIKQALNHLVEVLGHAFHLSTANHYCSCSACSVSMLMKRAESQHYEETMEWSCNPRISHPNRKQKSTLRSAWRFGSMACNAE